MTTATSELLLPGYRVDAASGAWVTLPWPDDPDEKADAGMIEMFAGDYLDNAAQTVARLLKK